MTALYNGWSSNGDLVLSTSFGAQDTFFIKEARQALSTVSQRELIAMEVPVEGLKEALQLLVEGRTRLKGIGTCRASLLFVRRNTPFLDPRKVGFW